MINQSENEIFPIVDANGQQIGSATRKECHSGSMLLHPVVHLHIFNNKGELYLQHRPEWKDIQPNKWDTAVGGHVDVGEDVEQALRREAREELGIDDFEAKFLSSYIFESEVEREYVNVFTTVYNKEITPSAETNGGRFWSIEEIHSAIGKGVLTPNFENEFREILESTTI